MITQRGFAVSHALITDDRELKDAFTQIVPETKRTRQEIKIAYRLARNGIYLPRSILFHPVCGIGAQYRTKFSPQVFGFDAADCTLPAGALRADKIAIVDHLVETVFSAQRIAEGSAGCLLNLRAGYGKTFVAAGLIWRLRLKTLYITIRAGLVDQARQDLLETCGLPSAAVDFCIVNSAAKKYNFSDYDLVIFDEAHRYGSPTWIKMFNMWPRCILGLSGTPHNSKYAQTLHHYFGTIVHAEDIRGFSYDATQFKLHVRAIFYHGPAKYTQNLVNEKTDEISTSLIHKQVVLEDAARQDLVMAEFMRLYQRGHTIFVFAEEVDFVQWFVARAHAIDDIYAPEVRKFTGGLKGAEAARIMKTARVFATTYGYSSTGISVKRASAILFLTSRKADMDQIVARILRVGSDESVEREIVDIVDANTILVHHYKKRYDAYMRQGATVERVYLK